MRVLRGSEAEKCVDDLAARRTSFAAQECAAKRIVDDVRRRGDAAVLEYGRKFDHLAKNSITVTRVEMSNARRRLPRELIRHVKRVAANVRQFAEQQKLKPWMRTKKGIEVGQLIRPIESVACYVPGGRYPLLSTLLMTVIPAQVVGVPRICVVSPNPGQELLGIAQLLGVKELYRIGGAQAIAAMAYGTESICPVDKIVGPGNAFVTAAKKLVAFDCAIDMLAGPTECVVVAHRGNPKWIASDLVAQSEHDPDCVSIFITTSSNLAAKVDEILKSTAENFVARQALESNGGILIAENRTQAMNWANQIAPEHITIDNDDLTRVLNAGSIFVGDYSAQAAGDYATGPNHVLPTAGAARFRGGLSVLDFVKVITVQRLTEQGLRRIAPTVTALAAAEGLKAHSESIQVRCPNA